MERERYGSGTAWESIVGYSRAVRVDDTIYVSGTTATDADGEVVGVGDPAAQTRQAIANVERAVHELGGELADVVRTRLFVTDVDEWEAIGRAHGDAFGGVGPAATMVEVARLIEPELLVEIEAEAVVGE